MTSKNGKAVGKIAHRFRCAVYTRKSSEDGLEQEFNSLDAQREAGEAYIKSQASEGCGSRRDTAILARFPLVLLSCQRLVTTHSPSSAVRGDFSNGYQA